MMGRGWNGDQRPHSLPQASGALPAWSVPPSSGLSGGIPHFGGRVASRLPAQLPCYLSIFLFPASSSHLGLLETLPLFAPRSLPCHSIVLCITGSHISQAPLPSHLQMAVSDGRSRWETGVPGRGELGHSSPFALPLVAPSAVAVSPLAPIHSTAVLWPQLLRDSSYIHVASTHGQPLTWCRFCQPALSPGSLPSLGDSLQLSLSCVLHCPV